VYTERSPLLRHILLSFALFLCAALLTGAGAVSKQKAVAGRMGQVVDWSARHVLYPQGASLRALALSERDPRAYWNYLRIMQAVNGTHAQAGSTAQPRLGDGALGDAAARTRDLPTGRFLSKQPKQPAMGQEDWSVTLGPEGTAANMYPAKFSFNVNAAPDCTNDYVVFTINVAPSAAQANIAAFNNLYSGTIAGTPGLCGGGTATPLWAYEISTFVLRTSPILSLDGTKVAFVDGATPAVFHVLTPTAGQGTVAAPATPTAGQIVNLPLPTGADTNSSPFVDYFNDVAYVGTNNGRIFKITGVFQGTPTLAGAPWPVRAGGGELTSVVEDFNTGNLFVGSGTGLLYGFTAAGAALPGSPMLVGDGTADGGIKDGPVLDEANEFLYESTGGNSGGTGAVLLQTSTTSFTTVQTAIIGTADAAPIHSGTFNDAYFSAPVNMPGTTSEWFFYVCGNSTGAVASPVLYRVGFSASRQMNAAVDAAQVSLSGNAGEQCSPLTELKNGVDRLFLGLRTLHVVDSFDLSTNTTPTAAGGPVTEAGGTSGIIIDNVSGANQASSIYFSTLGNSARCAVAGVNMHCAVKLTQSTLQ